MKSEDLHLTKEYSFGALLKDLYKAFDCLSHKLLPAKLHAYGFSIAALRLIQSYLTNAKQRTKINLSYSPWEEILFCAPQGSILGPLLFNIVKKPKNHIISNNLILSKEEKLLYRGDVFFAGEHVLHYYVQFFMRK